MKIEKINENSIKCTVYKDELINMHLNIDNITYGSENANILFKKALSLAKEEFDFDIEKSFTVEAIPMIDGSIVLNITKVEMPDELDTRFSKFSYRPVPKETLVPSFMQIIGNIFDTEFDEVPQITASIIEIPKSSIRRVKMTIDYSNRVFSFDKLDQVIDACKNIQNRFYSSVKSSLYKDEDSAKYYLYISLLDSNNNALRKHFDIVCNTLSEYGTIVNSSSYNIAYYDEHYKLIIANDVLNKLSLL